jgi:catechol-2,3-dioxygenase
MTPDPPSLAGFYENIWGLKTVTSDNDAIYLRGTGSEHHILAIYRGSPRRLHHISFALPDRNAVDEAADQLAQAGMRAIEGPARINEPGGGYGFRILDPERRCLEFSSDVTPLEPLRVDTEYVSPTKISHVVLNSQEVEKIVEFFTNLLGFRISDRTADLMVFLRCNSDHHSIALSRAPHVSLNHIAFEVTTKGDILRGIEKLNRYSFPVVWGPGRHGPGNNVFAYFQDPSGQIIEYTSEVFQIEDENSYKPKVWLPGSNVELSSSTTVLPSAEARSAMLGEPDPGLFA